MVKVRRERSRLLALAAILLVAVAWLAVGARLDRVDGQGSHPTSSEDGRRDVVSSRDVADAIVAPALAASRGFDVRLLGFWVLPGLAAALAALRQRRRQQLRPVLLRVPVRAGRAANRAPPSGSTV